MIQRWKRDYGDYLYQWYKDLMKGTTVFVRKRGTDEYRKERSIEKQIVNLETRLETVTKGMKQEVEKYLQDFLSDVTIIKKRLGIHFRAYQRKASGAHDHRKEET